MVAALKPKTPEEYPAMIEWEVDLQRKRVERFAERLERLMYPAREPLALTLSTSDEPVPWEKRPAGGKSIEIGEVWGRTWQSGWFNMKGKVPREWMGERVVALINLTGEACIFDEGGSPVYGLTGFSVMKPGYYRNRYPLLDRCRGEEEIELWVEASASGLFGAVLNKDPDLEDPERFGSFEAVVREAHLAIFRRDIWRLLMDVRVLGDQLKALPERSVRWARVLRGLKQVVDQFQPDVEQVRNCRRLLKPLTSSPAVPSALTTRAVGHAHIDTAWLWPLSETIRKCGRTFATQIALIENYPRYVFGASQPQLYQYTKDHYPRLYERIRQAVKARRWELQGGMWVEADANLIGGESMVRQFLYGKRFFMEEFGIEVRNLWLPDVFGYAASMPQILRKAGVDRFLTQKISWSQFNHFPHHTFRWIGIDGTDILVHFPPEDTYNSTMQADGLIRAQDHFAERDFANEFMTLFGIGDGGGGPTEEHIEMGHRQANLEGSPKVEFGPAQDMLERIAALEEDLPEWVGELYLELHRGTLTSQAYNKKMNRRLEGRLRDLEILSVCRPPESYPREALERLWKVLLLNQFHDIIPGSSINRVYRDSRAHYEQVESEVGELLGEAGKSLFDGDQASLTLVNTTVYDQTEPIRLPDSWSGGAVDAQGDTLQVQKEEEGHLWALVSVPAQSAVAVARGSGGVEQTDALDRSQDGGWILENELVRYEFDNRGVLISGLDKKSNTAILNGPAEIQFFEDRPHNWDAWEVDISYEDQLLQVLTPSSCDGFSGPVRSGLRLEYRFSGSTMSQLVSLRPGSRRLDFLCRVDWAERHKMLRAAFFTPILNGTARFDIQFGTVERPTHRNTSWDRARFEVCGHRFADLSAGDWGVAVLNDCKYGYKVYRGQISLNLLRSPTHPDAEADRGTHEFTYSLLPHHGMLADSEVFAEATALNQRAPAFAGRPLATYRPPVRVEGEGIVLEAVKRAEDDDDLIVRVFEWRGVRASGSLALAVGGSGPIEETDLLERPVGDLEMHDGAVELELGPYEIRTFRIPI
jgi:alpha-mannosidase